MATVHPRIDVSLEDMEAFCRRWEIVEFSLFGSVLREDCRPDSDIDVLVRFAESRRPHLFRAGESAARIGDALFSRPVDVVEVGRIENPFRRRSIMRERAVVVGSTLSE